MCANIFKWNAGTSQIFIDFLDNPKYLQITLYLFICIVLFFVIYKAVHPKGVPKVNTALNR